MSCSEIHLLLGITTISEDLRTHLLDLRSIPDGVCVFYPTLVNDCCYETRLIYLIVWIVYKCFFLVPITKIFPRQISIRTVKPLFEARKKVFLRNFYYIKFWKTWIEARSKIRELNRRASSNKDFTVYAVLQLYKWNRGMTFSHL